MFMPEASAEGIKNDHAQNPMNEPHSCILISILNIYINSIQIKILEFYKIKQHFRKELVENEHESDTACEVNALGQHVHLSQSV